MYACMYVYLCMYVYICIYVCMYVCMYVCTYIYTCTHTYTYTHTHTYTHIHTYGTHMEYSWDMNGTLTDLHFGNQDYQQNFLQAIRDPCGELLDDSAQQEPLENKGLVHVAPGYCRPDRFQGSPRSHSRADAKLAQKISCLLS